MVASDEGARLPVLAELNIVLKKVGSPPEVLVVVSIKTLSLVVVMIEGTPLRLEVGDEELEVGLAAKFGFLGLDQVQESNFYILDTVCETAVVAIVTSGNVARVGVTEFCLVFLGVVKTFDPVVGPAAFLAFGAFLSVCKFTKFRSVDEIRASEVFS